MMIASLVVLAVLEGAALVFQHLLLLATERERKSLHRWWMLGAAGRRKRLGAVLAAKQEHSALAKV